MSSLPYNDRFSSEFPSSPEYNNALHSMCHSTTELLGSGYDMTEDPGDRIEKKLKCTKCLVRVYRPEGPAAASEPKSTVKKCVFHSGRLFAGKWKCCKKPLKDTKGHIMEGCTRNSEHTIAPPNDPELRKYWRYFSTAPQALSHTKDNTTSTGQQLQKWTSLGYHVGNHVTQYRKAVVMDCEMGVSSTAWPELIRLSLVDYFSGETLIDNLISPSVGLRSLKTKYSGVSWDMMWRARNSGNCYLGRDAAREAILKHVGPETILVAHAGENDLNVLRWIHPRIVDTQMIQLQRDARTARPRENVHRTGLQDLSYSYTGIPIQQGEKGHDSLEDALATREVMHVFVQDRLEMDRRMATIPPPALILPAPQAPFHTQNKGRWAHLKTSQPSTTQLSTATTSSKASAQASSDGWSKITSKERSKASAKKSVKGSSNTSITPARTTTSNRFSLLVDEADMDEETSVDALDEEAGVDEETLNMVDDDAYEDEEAYLDMVDDEFDGQGLGIWGDY